MKTKNKAKIAISIIVVLVLLGGAAAYLVYSGTIQGITGFSRENDNGLGIDPAQLPEVTLTFALHGFDPKNSEEILNELQKKTLKDMNVRLNFKWDNISQLKTMDLIRFYNDSYNDCDAFCLGDMREIGADIRNSLKQGLVMDIKELFPRYAPNYYQKFDPAELAPATYEGKLGLVPHYVPGTTRRCAVVREDLMKKYNISEINNYDDLEKFLKAVKGNESGITPLFLNTWNDATLPYVYDTTLKLFSESYGYVITDYGLGIVYKWDDPKMKLTAWEQTPEYTEAVQRLKRWRDNGFYYNNGQKFDMRKCAAFITSKLDLFHNNRNNSLGSNSDIRFKIFELYPDKMYQRNTGIWDTALFAGVAVSPKSKNPERVLMFLEWLQSSQENYDLLMYGIKGKNYVLYGDQLDFPKDAETDELTYINWPGHESFMNLDNERTNLMYSPDFKKNHYEELKSRSKFAPHAGLIPDLEPVKNIAGNRAMSYCYIEEVIRTDSFKDKLLDDFIRDEKGNNVDKLIEVLQKQLDDWKVANKK